MLENFLLKSIIAYFVLFSFEQVYAQEYKDCENPYRICELKTYNIKNMKGVGSQEDSFIDLKCTDQLTETNSYWMDFVVTENGTLTFVIDPSNNSDDLDFILFQKLGERCDRLQEVRCMSSGRTYGSLNQNCTGETGLSIRSVDDFEKAGCKFNDDNYLKFLDAQKGEHYVLMINNYNSGEGFSISFEGDCELKSSTECIPINLSNPITLIDLYPNPANSVININYSTEESADIVFTVYDIVGKSVLKEQDEVSAGKNLKSLTVDELDSGTYILSITKDAYTINKRFIKQ